MSAPTSPTHSPVHVQVPGVGTYAISGDGPTWTLTAGVSESTDADVVMRASRTELARFLASAPDNRDAASPGVELVGKPAAVRTLLRALAVFPFGRAPRKVLVG